MHRRCPTWPDRIPCVQIIPSTARLSNRTPFACIDQPLASRSRTNWHTCIGRTPAMAFRATGTPTYTGSLCSLAQANQSPARLQRVQDCGSIHSTRLPCYSAEWNPLKDAVGIHEVDASAFPRRSVSFIAALSATSPHRSHQHELPLRVAGSGTGAVLPRSCPLAFTHDRSLRDAGSSLAPGSCDQRRTDSPTGLTFDARKQDRLIQSGGLLGKKELIVGPEIPHKGHDVRQVAGEVID